MKKFWFKLLNWIGFEIEEEVVEEKHDDFSFDGTKTRKFPTNNPSTNIISIHQNKPVKIAYINPVNYEQVQCIADHLRNSRPVIVNLESIEKNLAKRIMDFLSGTTYAISGSMQKINPNIFIVLPQNFSMINMLDKNETTLKSESNLSWNKSIES